MSLTGRFSALFLGALGVVLTGYSAALYGSARLYLDRQLRERLAAASAVLAAAAEIHPDGVEWEPQERLLRLGHEAGTRRLRWMIFDNRGRRIDQSQNLSEAELTPAWSPRPGSTELPARLVDRQGRTWQVLQRRLRPRQSPKSGSQAAVESSDPPAAERAELVHPWLVVTVCASLDPLWATLSALAWFLTALTVGIWLSAALLCRRLSRQALAPLTRMVESARGLDASDSGWSLQKAGTGDELDELGSAFNELLSRLHVAYERQRRFGSHASHQLRTPLTVLMGQIEVALRRERSGEEYRRVLRSALGRAVQLGQIVDALLFLGRAEGDSQLPQGERIELNRWVAEQVADLQLTGPLPIVRGGSPENEPLWIQAHPPLLRQLLDNLVDNARKYGGPGTPIIIETLRERDSAVLAVEDTGPGMPSEETSRIFEPFYRSAEARRQGTPGVGLGLTVVQRIATAFGGD
ncbi:MAG TPA: ATP-binding protein, partial [Solirubrobacteraceae bacterium]